MRAISGLLVLSLLVLPVTAPAQTCSGAFQVEDIAVTISRVRDVERLIDQEGKRKDRIDRTGFRVERGRINADQELATLIGTAYDPQARVPNLIHRAREADFFIDAEANERSEPNRFGQRGWRGRISDHQSLAVTIASVLNQNASIPNLISRSRSIHRAIDAEGNERTEPNQFGQRDWRGRINDELATAVQLAGLTRDRSNLSEVIRHVREAKELIRQEGWARGSTNHYGNPNPRGQINDVQRFAVLLAAALRPDSAVPDLIHRIREVQLDIREEGDLPGSYNHYNRPNPRGEVNSNQALAIYLAAALRL